MFELVWLICSLLVVYYFGVKWLKNIKTRWLLNKDYLTSLFNLKKENK